MTGHDRAGILEADRALDAALAKVAENAKALLSEIDRKKPVDAKADFVRSVSVSSSMGPGVWVNVKEEA